MLIRSLVDNHCAEAKMLRERLLNQERQKRDCEQLMVNLEIELNQHKDDSKVCLNQEFGRGTIFPSRGGKNVNMVCNYVGCRFRTNYACIVEGNRVSLQYLARTKTHGIKAHKNDALKTG